MGQPVRFSRRKFNIHPIQRTYFSLFLAPLLFFAFFLILLALIPFGSAHQGPAYALRDFRVWLALLFSMIASGLLSYFITNKFAGPLYRVEQALRRFKEGDLPRSVRIRTGDDLQELVDLFDGTFKRFATTLTAINEQQVLATTELTAVQGKVKAGSNGDVLTGLEQIGRNLQEIENILANFKLPTP